MTCEFVKKHIVSDNEFFTFKIEEFRDGPAQFLLVHMQFKQHTPTALKVAKREWNLLRTIVTAPLYAVRNDGDEEKWKHFVSLFGFAPTNIRVPCNNGEIRELFISTVSHDGR